MTQNDGVAMHTCSYLDMTIFSNFPVRVSAQRSLLALPLKGLGGRGRYLVANRLHMTINGLQMVGISCVMKPKSRFEIQGVM